MQETQNPLLSESDVKVGAGETAECAASEAADIDSMPSPEELLKAAELRAAEHHDAWLRAKADTENLRRRAQEDVSKAHKFAAEKFAGELLAVKDSLEAALAVETQTVEAIKAGVELTLKQLVAAFEKSSVTELNPLGEKYDPRFHQAIALVEAGQEPNTVVSVLQKGYALHERLLRPAMVTVAKPKSAA
ncbi:MAG: nucleotide exchange factor GrpE [Rhodocyclaceae bacterium]|nr:nucleotide exchange factor GrpE [Rhodocyclaceae bacterium]MDP1957223.1 nucleotide exchange factor GrpE [Rhodocyclaceae bacterium]